MAGETNRLIALAREIQPHPDPRELDVIAATGEQVTIGLLSMALLELGVKAKSYSGWQVKILTDSAFTKARITSIDDKAMRADLKSGLVVIVAGFQGVDEKGNITTLGRGGSDTSAVALAAALKADECHIFTDVDGVYTTDPRIVPDAKRLRTVTFEEMLEMAGAGSKVLQIRSVEFAGKYKVPTRVLSSLSDPALPVAEEAQAGTLITFEEDPHMAMEKAVISGVAFNRDEAKITVHSVPDRPGIAYAILGPVADGIRQLFEEGIRRMIQDGVYGVQTESVEMKVGDPIKRVIDEVAPYVIAIGAVEIHRRPPGGFVALGVVRGEVRQIIPFGSEMVVDNVEDRRDPMFVAGVDQPFQPQGSAVGVLRGEWIGAIVSPVSSPGKLRDGHEFHGRDAQGLEIGDMWNDCFEGPFG